MSITEGRHVNMKLYIPPEASNVFHDEGKDCVEEISQQRICVAKEKRIASLTRILQPTFCESFYFLHITGPSRAKSCIEIETSSKHSLKSLISKINKMVPPPKFIALSGGLKNTGGSCVDGNESKNEHIEKALQSLDHAVRVVCVPSAEDFNNKANCDNIQAYRSVFGDDWYSFWVCGVSFMTINSLYYKQDIDTSLNAYKAEQEDWIDSGLLQQQVFCVQWTLIFQDSLLLNNEDDNTPRGQNVGLLRKYQKAGISHVICREFDENIKNYYDINNIEIIAHNKNEHANNDWGVIMVKITTEKVEHKTILLDEFPEIVDL